MKCSYILTSEAEALGAWQIQRKSRIMGAIFYPVMFFVFTIFFLRDTWPLEWTRYLLIILLVSLSTFYIIQAIRKTPPVLFRKQFKKQYQQSIKANEIELTVSIEDGFFIVETKNGVNRKRLNGIHKMVESKDFFYLYHSEKFAQMVPKAPLTPEIVEAMRGLVKN